MPAPAIAATKPFDQTIFRPDGWETDIPVARDETGQVYWPVRALCTWLGIDSVSQLKRLKKHPSTQNHLRYYLLNFSKRGNSQPTWCIQEKRIAMWFLMLDDARIKGHIHEKLIQFQDEMAEVADERLFGRRQNNLLTPEQVAQEISSIKRNIDRLTFAYIALSDKFDDRSIQVPPIALPDASEDIEGNVE